MSADPVTMFVMTAAKTVMDIKESRKQSKLEQQRFELKKEQSMRIAKEQEDDRINDLRMAKAHNLAVAAGAGYSSDSRGFLNVQEQQDIVADKDIARIRLNISNEINEYSLAQQQTASKRKNEQFGGWLSIASAGAEAKYKKDLYDA